MKILFVDDNLPAEKVRYLDLPFGKEHAKDTEYVTSPVNLSALVEQNDDLRLIILDILWPGAGDTGALAIGADAMRELNERAPDIPVIIHSSIDNDELLREHLPEMMRLGAYDWVDKSESRLLRSFRFERAYNEGRDSERRPTSRAILAREQTERLDVHVAIMFLDMSGFTELTYHVGGARVVRILEQFYELVSREVMKLGGYVDKYIGDAVLAVFGAGIAIEDPDYLFVAKAIQAARKVLAQGAGFRINTVEPELRHSQAREIGLRSRIGEFRVGLESGPVAVRRFHRGSESELTFIGTPVNIASRLLGHAQDGELWLGYSAWSNGARPDEVLEEKEFAHKNLPGMFKGYKVGI